MHQLEIVKVASYAFRAQTSAIGQIGYNEDASTIVLTPFSGRVTRLIAKLGDQVKRGDPLLEIDSPEQLVQQNDFIAAQAAKSKASSQHNLAQIVEKRVRDLHEGKAAPSKDLQQAEAQLAAPKTTCASADTAFEAARARLRILGRTDAEILETRADRHAQPRHHDHGADRRHRRFPQGWARAIRQGRFGRRRCIRSPISRRCG